MRPLEVPRVPEAQGHPWHRWAPHVGLLTVGIVVVVLGYLGTWRATVRVWTESETFGHGFLIAPIAGWLCWQLRGALAAMTPRASWWGVSAVLACGAVWLLGTAAGINLVAAFAVVAMIPALVIAFAGVRVGWAMAFPLAFLFFMVPAGDGLTPMLMERTADATVRAVAASGVPVYREGLSFMLPSGRWSVVEACSGLRYVIAAAVLSSLFAYINFSRIRTRLVFIAIALLVALLANWFRAYLIVMIGHLSGMRLGVGDDHVWYGWIFFGITMFVVFWMGARWREPETMRGAAIAGRTGAAAGAPGASTVRRTLVIGAAALASLLAAPLLLGGLLQTMPRQDAEARMRAALGPGFEAGEPMVVPRFAGARATLQGVLDRSHQTDVYVAYFADQTSGPEMITFGNTVLDSADPTWKVSSRADRSVPLRQGNVRVQEWIVRAAAGDRLLWSWYTVGGREAARETPAKGLTVLSILSGRGDHATVTVAGTRIDGGGAGPVDATGLEAARRRLAVATEGLVAGARSATGPLDGAR